MGYLENTNWDQIRKDLQKELEKGMATIRNGVIVVQKKAEELTEEGRRKYKLVTLKARVHELIRDLGARVYSVMKDTKARKNPALDPGVKVTASRIRELEAQIAAIEGKTPENDTARKTQAGARRKAGSKSAAARTRAKATIRSRQRK